MPSFLRLFVLLPLGGEVVRTQAYPAVPTRPGENMAALYPLAKGEYMVVLDRPIAEGNLNRTTITWVRSSGDTIRVRHLTSRPVPISDRQWEARLEERFQTASRSRLSRQDYLRAVRRPPSFPPASSLVIAKGGKYWLAREDILGADERRWVALDGEGYPLFEIRLPRHFQLHEAMGDALWGVMLDDLGVPWIHRYSIRQPGG